MRMQQPGAEAAARAEAPALGPPAEELVAPADDLVCGLLLAAVDDLGYMIPARRELSMGLAAAALAELVARRRVVVDDGRVLVSDTAPTGDGVVDPVLESLAARRKAPTVDQGLDELSLDWTILGRAGHALEKRGLVRVERRALHPLLMHRFHPVPPTRAIALRSRLSSILEAPSPGSVATREAALAALTAATGCLPAAARRSAADALLAAPGDVLSEQAAEILLALGRTLGAGRSRNSGSADRLPVRA